MTGPESSSGAWKTSRLDYGYQEQDNILYRCKHHFAAISAAGFAGRPGGLAPFLGLSDLLTQKEQESLRISPFGGALLFNLRRIPSYCRISPVRFGGCCGNGGAMDFSATDWPRGRGLSLGIWVTFRTSAAVRWWLPG